MLNNLSHQPCSRIVALGFSLTFLVFLGDYLTGVDSSVLILYVLPVCIVAWFAGRRWGLATALASGLAWFVADALVHHTGITWMAVWNAVMRGGVFIALSVTVSALSESARRKEELLHFIVHDLRSPLTNVLSGLQTLQQHSEGLDEVQNEVVGIAAASATRMSVLIDSLLDLPRLENQSLPLKVRTVSPDEILEAARSQVSLWAQQSGVTLRLEPHPGTPLVQVDPDVTGRVLVNLLANALKFSPAGGTITVRAAPHAEGMVSFSVSDEGPGVPAEWLEKVFEEYAQVEGARTAVRGTGLGLSFCRLAVHAQQGRIWMESSLGHGATVIFTAPAAG